MNNNCDLVTDVTGAVSADNISADRPGERSEAEPQGGADSAWVMQ